MSSWFALFLDIATGPIETLFKKQNQTLFKRADLGKYLDNVDVAHKANKVKAENTGSGSALILFRHVRGWRKPTLYFH